jgi:N-acetyl-gamma-glutamyl-phosphate reductase
VIDVAVIGASGYTGLELIKLLINHPKFNIAYIANSEGDIKLSQLHPSLQSVLDMDVKKADTKEVAEVAEVAFLALPHKTSMGFASKLLKLGVKVVDLSADYRLELDTYERYYTTHTDVDNLKNAVYGLPELNRDKIAKSSLIANPGCYPTASLLGLLPFLEYIDESCEIFIDAKSSPSGAGKKLSETTQFMSVNDNTFIYNPIKHRHAPEIIQMAKLISNKNLKINFVPSLIPASRGMLVNIYATLKNSIDTQTILSEFYQKEKMVRVKKEPVDIKNTAGTNFADIFTINNDKALIISVSIDNLLRGSSSQALANANIMMGFDEDLGINHIAYVP